MKPLIALCALMLAPLAAHATIANQAQSIANQLNQVENRLHPRDAEEIRFSLDRVDQLLRRYGGNPGGPSELICVSNGESGVWEKFFVYNPATNSNIGGATSNANCRDVIASQRNGLICLSNGENGVWEKFQTYDTRSNMNVGGNTALATCKQLTVRSSDSFLCVSNGENGVWEKFNLFNRIQRVNVGGSTSLDNCLSSMPGGRR